MLTYGDFQVDETTLPPASISALLQQAFGHRLGNQADAAVTAKIRGKDFLGSDATRDAVKAWREANAEQVEAWTREARQSQLDAIVNGTMGARTGGGPRLDPVDKKFNELVLKYIRGALKAHNVKMPKEHDVEFQVGNATRTVNQMIANATASQGERLRKEAVKLVAAEARAAKSEVAGLDELGI